jgi:hypothetical protein
VSFRSLASSPDSEETCAHPQDMLRHGAKFDGLETWDQIAENKEQLHLLCDPKLFAQFSSAVLSIIPCEAVILKEFLFASTLAIHQGASSMVGTAMIGYNRRMRITVWLSKWSANMRKRRRSPR